MFFATVAPPCVTESGHRDVRERATGGRPYIIVRGKQKNCGAAHGKFAGNAGGGQRGAGDRRSPRGDAAFVSRPYFSSQRPGGTDKYGTSPCRNTAFRREKKREMSPGVGRHLRRFDAFFGRGVVEFWQKPGDGFRAGVEV